MCIRDRPFYAHYLAATGYEHPGRDEILAAQAADEAEVVASLLGPPPAKAGRAPRIFYQKHMSQHLLPDMDRSWLDSVRHALLIREPAAVIASYSRVIPNPSAADLGYAQLTEIHGRVGAPPVVDARDLLANPRAMLERLCERLGIGFDDSMLAWPPGRRDSDGVWAPHWYANVERSTGFAPPPPPPRSGEVELPPELQPVLAECQEHYRALYSVRLEV